MHHVLIVDDSMFARAATKKALAPMHGIQILEARDGAEALEVMTKHPVQVVITDLEMPGMDGFQFLVELRRKHSHAWVIVQSSLAQSDDRIGQKKIQMCQSAGAFRVIPKPKKTAGHDLSAEMGAVQDEQLLMASVREALSNYIPPVGAHSV